MTDKKNCVLCGKETTGSIGAAGIKWPNICQKCKDSEDEIVKQQVVNLGKLWNQLFDRRNLD